MKYLGSIFVILLCISIGFGQISRQETSDNESKTILISKVSKTINKDELKLEFDLENKSDRNVLIAVNPRKLSGEKGYYLLLNKDDNSTLEVSSCVYPKYPWETYSNGIDVELKQLKPGEKYSDKILIKFPVKETTPPYYDPFPKNKKIIPENIKQIRLIIGYFMDTETTLKFTNIDPSGWYVRGETKLPTHDHKDKTFFEIQKLAAIGIPVAFAKK